MRMKVLFDFEFVDKIAMKIERKKKQERKTHTGVKKLL